MQVSQEEAIYMHLSENPWLAAREIAGDLQFPLAQVTKALRVLVSDRRVVYRNRKGQVGRKFEFDVAPQSTPPGIKRSLPPASAGKSKSGEVKGNPKDAMPLVNVVHGIHVELASPKGKIILDVPHWTPEPDLKKAIEILEALLA